MDLTPYVSSLRDSLATAAQAASDDVREAAGRLSYAVEPSLRLTLISAFGDAADEITGQLDGIAVEVRIRGGDPEFVATDMRMAAIPTRPTPSAPPTPPQPPSAPEPDDSLSRISLRIPESMKARVEEAAVADGLSVNSWLVRSIGQVLDGPRAGGHGPTPPGVPLGRRISGWAR